MEKSVRFSVRIKIVFLQLLDINTKSFIMLVVFVFEIILISNVREILYFYVNLSFMSYKFY
jgi:hypothetical protein